MHILRFGLLAACVAFPSAATAQSNPRVNVEMRGSTHPVPDNFAGYRRSRDIAFRSWKADQDKRLNSYAYRPLLRFAECVSRFDKDAAGRVLSTPLKSIQSGNALMRAASINRGCIVEHGMVHPLLLRAALAETSLKAGAESPIMGAQRPVGVPAVVDGYPLRVIADCQVRRAPQLVRDLFATEPGDAGERLAAETLFGRTGECGATHLGRLAPTAARLALVDAEYARRFAVKD